MKKIKVGIIGCGRIFPMHALPVEVREDLELVAVCDIKEERAQTAATKHNCASYTDYMTMFEEEDMDAIHICLPHHLHAPVAIEAAKRKIHVLTEKPMAITMEDAENMVAAADENNISLGVIFQNRYNQSSQLIKNMLENGTLGAVKSSKLSLTWDRSDDYYRESDWKGTWDKEGGGVIIDQAIHTMDIVRWLIDDEIDYVDAVIANRAHDFIEVEDTAEGVIKYKSGVVTAFYAINYYSYDAPVEAELHCENGIVNMIGDYAEIKLNDGRTFTAENNPNETFEYEEGVKSYWGVNHIKQINNFYDALKAGTQPDITGKEALKTQKMIVAVYDSGKSGKRVAFD
ncbi:Phthalate 4,5-cis-dihydrodiol dehydrogenase [Lentibacillus sp. JNUCC-1]|uniref:Gfo/Idh/MocA family protein n=1 Tax=Lentibacillus sp. JNUCC-1 TaxID=2654513 RepID=UPI0012E78158|nr:Gfo/Idh/MocA family oxidoreductase [Lentibacillus sp. JNUCC-1]MUV37255.1 Phthalate 4,5-cis-dihydrodiol dehydrogenase [Lentibacillus sp. JNUCC-1]